MMNFISGEEEIFSIIQNGHEKDDRGMTLVVGPAWAQMDLLYKEFSENAGKSRLYPVKSIGHLGTYRTALFSEWLIEFKGFRQLNFIPAYLEDLEAPPKDSAIVCETFDEIVEKFKEHAKGVSLNKCYMADDPSKLRIGWVIDKGDAGVAHIVIHLRHLKNEIYKQRSDLQATELLGKSRETKDDRQRLLAWLVGLANGNTLA